MPYRFPRVSTVPCPATFGLNLPEIMQPAAVGGGFGANGGRRPSPADQRSGAFEGRYVHL